MQTHARWGPPICEWSLWTLWTLEAIHIRFFSLFYYFPLHSFVRRSFFRSLVAKTSAVYVIQPITCAKSFLFTVNFCVSTSIVRYLMQLLFTLVLLLGLNDDEDDAGNQIKFLEVFHFVTRIFWDVLGVQPRDNDGSQKKREQPYGKYLSVFFFVFRLKFVLFFCSIETSF